MFCYVCVTNVILTSGPSVRNDNKKTVPSLFAPPTGK